MQPSMVKEKINLVLYFLDSLTHEILIWKHIQIERVDDYKYLLVELLNLGYTILYVTIDVKRGVNSVFKVILYKCAISTRNVLFKDI